MCCLVPVQAQLANLALGDICTALELHPDQTELQAKGLVVLGVLGQVRCVGAMSPTVRHLRRCLMQCAPLHPQALALRPPGSLSQAVEGPAVPRQ